MIVNSENLDKILRYERDQPNIAVIDWLLGNVCNYKCHYCFSDSNTGDKKMPPFDIFEHNFYYFINVLKQNNLVPYFKLSGGEPTVYREIVKILRLIKENNFKSVIVTNGSRTLNWWTKNLDCLDSVSISYHPEYANRDHILNLVKILREKSVFVTMMASPKKHLFDKLIEDHDYFLQNDIVAHCNLTITPLRLDKKIYDYTPDQLQFIEKNFRLNCTTKPIKREAFVNGYDEENNKYDVYNNILAKLNPDFTGWECSIAKEHITIDYKGFINANCGQKIFKTSFNMYKDDLEYKGFNLPKKNTICTVGRCMCMGLYAVSKKRIL